jgi:hypothetical protein
MLLDLCKLGSISVVLIVIGTNCFAEPQAQSSVGPTGWPPRRHACLDVLELEKLRVDPKSGAISFNFATEDSRLLVDYAEVAGWLEGFLLGWKFGQGITGTFAEIPQHKWMTWIFSFCREHPSDDLIDAAPILGNTLFRLPYPAYWGTNWGRTK